jgi:hypothetical protein
MRISHGADDVRRVDRAGKSDDVPAACNPSDGSRSMVIRAVWRLRRLFDIKQTLREMEVPSTRNADILGVSGPDFSKMTRGLFDRQPR